MKRGHESCMSGENHSVVMFISLLVQFYSPKGSWSILSPKAFLKKLLHLYLLHISCSFLVLCMQHWSFKLHFHSNMDVWKAAALQESMKGWNAWSIKLGLTLNILEAQICSQLGRWAFNFFTSFSYCCLIMLFFNWFTTSMSIMNKWRDQCCFRLITEK